MQEQRWMKGERCRGNTRRLKCSRGRMCICMSMCVGRSCEFVPVFVLRTSGPRNWNLSLLSREGDPPKKPPTQIKTVCTNSLRKLFCLFSAYFKGKKGDSLYKLSQNCLRKLFVQTVFIWVGGFLGGSSLHSGRPITTLGFSPPLDAREPLT